MTSAGDAEIEVTCPQLNVLAVMSAEPASGGVVLHARITETFVVALVATLNVAVPAQVAVVSVDVPVRKML
jgi:hypothetical protein